MQDDDKRKNLEKTVGSLKKRLKAMEEKMADDTINAGYDISGRMEKAASTYRKIQREFIREGQGFFDKFTTGQQYNIAFEQVAKFGEKFFADSEKALRPMKDMALQMGNFITYGKNTQEELGRMAAVFSKLGLEAKTFGGIIDTASRAFGKNEEEIKKLGLTMMNLSEDLLLNPEQLAQNFKSAQKSMAYDSETLLYTFKKLQFTSKATGVSFDTLTSAFGNTMDSFQGSANIAGKLNAVLGKSVFNSMDLLGKTESQRIETIVSGLTNSLGSRIGSLGKFEMKAIADTLGLSPEDTRRLLRGGGNIAEVLKKRTEDPEKKKTRAMEGTTKALNKFKKVIRDSRSAFEQFNVEMSAGLIDKFEKDIHPKVGAQAASLFRVGSTAFDSAPSMLMREIRDRSIFMSGGEIAKLKGPILKGNWGLVAKIIRERSGPAGNLDMTSNILNGINDATGNTDYLKFEAIRAILNSKMGPIKKAHLLRTISSTDTLTLKSLQTIISGSASLGSVGLDKGAFAKAKDATARSMWTRALGKNWITKAVFNTATAAGGDMSLMSLESKMNKSRAGGPNKMKALAGQEIAESSGASGFHYNQNTGALTAGGALAREFKPPSHRIAMGRGDNITNGDASRIASHIAGLRFKITKQGAKLIVELALAG